MEPTRKRVENWKLETQKNSLRSLRMYHHKALQPRPPPRAGGFNRSPASAVIPRLTESATAPVRATHLNTTTWEKPSGRQVMLTPRDKARSTLEASASNVTDRTPIPKDHNVPESAIEAHRVGSAKKPTHALRPVYSAPPRRVAYKHHPALAGGYSQLTSTADRDVPIPTYSIEDVVGSTTPRATTAGAVRSATDGFHQKMRRSPPPQRINTIQAAKLRERVATQSPRLIQTFLDRVLPPDESSSPIETSNVSDLPPSSDVMDNAHNAAEWRFISSLFGGISRIGMPITKVPSKYHEFQRSKLPHDFPDVQEVRHNSERKEFELATFPSSFAKYKHEAGKLGTVLQRMLDEKRADLDSRIVDGDVPGSLDAVETQLQIYDIVLSEIARQSLVACAERGALVERVRERYKSFIHALIAMASQSDLKARHTADDAEDRVRDLEAKLKAADERNADLQSRLDEAVVKEKETAIEYRSEVLKGRTLAHRVAEMRTKLGVDDLEEKRRQSSAADDFQGAAARFLAREDEELLLKNALRMQQTVQKWRDEELARASATDNEVLEEVHIPTGVTRLTAEAETHAAIVDALMGAGATWQDALNWVVNERAIAMGLDAPINVVKNKSADPDDIAIGRTLGSAVLNFLMHKQSDALSARFLKHMADTRDAEHEAELQRVNRIEEGRNDVHTSEVVDSQSRNVEAALLDKEMVVAMSVKRTKGPSTIRQHQVDQSCQTPSEFIHHEAPLSMPMSTGWDRDVPKWAARLTSGYGQVDGEAAFSWVPKIYWPGLLRNQPVFNPVDSRLMEHVAHAKLDKTHRPLPWLRSVACDVYDLAHKEVWNNSPLPTVVDSFIALTQQNRLPIDQETVALASAIQTFRTLDIGSEILARLLTIWNDDVFECFLRARAYLIEHGFTDAPPHNQLVPIKALMLAADAGWTPHSAGGRAALMKRLVLAADKFVDRMPKIDIDDVCVTIDVFLWVLCQERHIAHTSFRDWLFDLFTKTSDPRGMPVHDFKNMVLRYEPDLLEVDLYNAADRALEATEDSTVRGAERIDGVGFKSVALHMTGFKRYHMAQAIPQYDIEDNEPNDLFVEAARQQLVDLVRDQWKKLEPWIADMAAVLKDTAFTRAATQEMNSMLSGACTDKASGAQALEALTFLLGELGASMQRVKVLRFHDVDLQIQIHRVVQNHCLTVFDRDKLINDLGTQPLTHYLRTS